MEKNEEAEAQEITAFCDMCGTDMKPGDVWKSCDCGDTICQEYTCWVGHIEQNHEPDWSDLTMKEDGTLEGDA